MDSKGRYTNKCMKLDFPASVSSAHFVKLTLTENGKIVVDNFYLRGVEEGNYQALREMPKVTYDPTWQPIRVMTVLGPPPSWRTLHPHRL